MIAIKFTKVESIKAPYWVGKVYINGVHVLSDTEYIRTNEKIAKKVLKVRLESEVKGGRRKSETARQPDDQG